MTSLLQSEKSYNSIKGINWSTLKYLNTAPLAYRYYIDHPEPPKPAYILGGAIHCKILEPQKFDSRYAVFEGTRRGRVWEEWQDENAGKQSLKPDDLEHIYRVTEAVLTHPVALEILRGCRVEEPLTWEDPETGLKCKGRIDAINQVVIDLKTCRDPSPREFARAAARYLYHGQMAFYHCGAMTLKKISGDEMPYVIAAQNGAPYDVAVYRMKPDDLDRGRKLCVRLMQRLEECVAADYWPGCAPDLQYLDLPNWTPGGEEQSPEGDF